MRLAPPLLCCAASAAIGVVHVCLPMGWVGFVSHTTILTSQINFASFFTISWGMKNWSRLFHIDLRGHTVTRSCWVLHVAWHSLFWFMMKVVDLKHRKRCPRLSNPLAFRLINLYVCGGKSKEGPQYFRLSGWVGMICIAHQVVCILSLFFVVVRRWSLSSAGGSSAIQQWPPSRISAVFPRQCNTLTEFSPCVQSLHTFLLLLVGCCWMIEVEVWFLPTSKLPYCIRNLSLLAYFS